MDPALENDVLATHVEAAVQAFNGHSDVLIHFQGFPLDR